VFVNKVLKERELLVSNGTRYLQRESLAFRGEGLEPPRHSLCLWGLQFPLYPAGVKCLQLQSTKVLNIQSKKVYEIIEKSTGV
jgi:hypothetical protein